MRADYLVIGAGAMAMAFVETLLDESDATFVVVDRRHQPGGHWNTACPFVRLHQPSAFVVVNSLLLGRDRLDAVGGNAGLYKLAASGEIISYFARAMDERMLASGGVRYSLTCEYEGEDVVRSLVGDGR